MNRRLGATLLVPTLNEIEAIQVIMPQIQSSWIDEIIIIDGGSTDGTIEYMTQNGYRVHSQVGRGFGTGMHQGMLLAQNEIIVEFTPDGNSKPDAIPMLIAKIESGLDLVIASRYLDNAKSDDDDHLTAFGNWLFTKIVNLLFQSNYTDVLVGFRAYRKSCALTLDLDTPGLSWPCQTSMRFAARKFRTGEIPVDEPARIGGVRKMMPFRTGLEILRLILRDFWWRLTVKSNNQRNSQ